MLRRIKAIAYIVMIEIHNFYARQKAMFKLLPGEIKKAWYQLFPKKVIQKQMTWKEIYVAYKRLSKNKLFDILCNLISEKDGVLPQATRELRSKSKENSKKVIIQAIFNTFQQIEEIKKGTK